MRDIFISSYTQALSSRTAILQTLNRVINGVYFSLDPFAQTVEKWANLPIIYSQIHPDMKALSADPIAEIKRIGGREVGTIKNPRIELVGHPRLMADTQISDPVVNDLIDRGLVSLSTGFFAQDDNYQITGNVTPNHLLVFEESLYDQPRDLGAGFLNKNNTETYINEIKRSSKPMAEDGKAPETLTAEQIAKLEKIDVEQFLNMQQKFKEEMGKARAYQDELFSKNKNLEAKLNAFAQMEKDGKWESLKTMLPKGLIVGEEVQKTREWLNKDPEGLMMHVINIINREHTSELREQGKSYMQNITEKRKQETTDLCAGIYIHGDGGN